MRATFYLVTQTPKPFVRAALAVALAALAAGLAAATATAAKSPAPEGATGKNCWNALIRDWYDGRIDKTYPLHCYQDALKHLPTDVRAYSDAYDVISRALAAATRNQKKPNPDTPVPPPAPLPNVGTNQNTTTTTPGAGLPPGDSGDSGGGGSASGGGPIGGVLETGDRGSNGVPIPLLVLAGLAVLLVAAGGAGLVARRMQSRGRP